MAKRSSAPIRRILKSIPDLPGGNRGKRELQIIEETIAALMSDNSKMNRRSVEQNPILRADGIENTQGGTFLMKKRY